MLPTYLALALFAGIAAGSPIANQYIDSVIHTALPRELAYARLNPVIIPGFVTKFEDKLPIIGKVKGEAVYTRGNLTGLGQIRRYSECNGPYYKFGTKIINCTLGFDRLQLTYEGSVLGSVPTANQYLENILNTTLETELNNSRLEPAILPGFVTKFKGGDIDGEAEYYQGNVTGFPQVKRFPDRDCEGPFPNDYDTDTYGCTFEFEHLTITFGGKLKYGELPEISIEGTTHLYGTGVYFEASRSRQSGQGVLNEYYIAAIGVVHDVFFTGSEPLDSYTGFLTEDFLLHAQRSITGYFRNTLKNAINATLPSIPFPNEEAVTLQE